MKTKTCEILRKARKNCGYSMPQVEELLKREGCPAGKSSVSRWEMGYTNPSIDQFIALCRIYRIRDVVGTFSNGVLVPYLSELDELGRKKLDEYRQLLIRSGLYRPDDKVVLFTVRRTPFYLTEASAGHGVFLDSEEYMMVEVGPEVPLSANFGLPISGDSMEPDFHDGDAIWVQQQQTLEHGEIGLFMYNGQSYVKQFGNDKNGLRLISLNKAYPPMVIGPADTFRVFGKVVATTPRP